MRKEKLFSMNGCPLPEQGGRQAAESDRFSCDFVREGQRAYPVVCARSYRAKAGGKMPLFSRLPPALIRHKAKEEKVPTARRVLIMTFFSFA